MTLLDLRPGAGRKASTEPDVPARVFPQPLSAVFSDLLPDEVRTSRRLAYAKRRMAFVLLALALVLGLGDALARQQTSSASDDLATANLRINALNLQANRYAPVVGVQNETQQLTTLLTSAMAGGLSWAALTSTLQTLAPSGLTLTGVNGSVGPVNTAATPATGGTSGPTVVGTLSLTGTAPSLRAVADYVSALVAVRGLTAVNPATATGGSDTTSSLTFTITASLTSAAQGGRFTPATSTGTSSAAPAAPAAAPAAGATAGSAPVAPAAGGTATGTDPAPAGN